MFFNSASSTKDEGASLTSVLETPALRVELAVLVLLCTDAMRSDLVNTFDTPRTNPESTTQHLISSEHHEIGATMVDIGAKGGSQQQDESTQMQALRRGALTFFDKWRAAVMHRICDVLCLRSDTVRQAKARRKQTLAEAEKQRRGIASLIDFDEDPFANKPRMTTTTPGSCGAIDNKLLALDQEKRMLILHCLLLLVLSLENYAAHSRVLLMRLASSLAADTAQLAEHETSVAQGLLANAASQMDAKASTQKQTANDAAARRWKVGLAAVGGAVLIGVTGGLAAPLLAAGLGSVVGGLGLSLGVMGTYLGALASSSVLVGSLFGAYGAKMTGKLMEQYAREVQDFEFVPVQDPGRTSLQRSNEWNDELDARDPTKREQHRLRVCIGISGWLSSPTDVIKPWEVINAATTEPFALRFELDAMLRLGNSLNDVLFNYAWDGLTYTVVSRTILGALYAGLWPLGLLKLASVLDNPFTVAISRADKAGKVLAHALIDSVQGKRPVTLIGYSIGARVIYSCLIELADQHAFGLVETAVLMGTPAPAKSISWRRIRSVVASRVVNAYSTEDYVLGYLYRSSKLESSVAGLHDITDVCGIENVNVSDLVSGHDHYRYVVGKILSRVGLGDVCAQKVVEQERALVLAERKKQQAFQRAKQQHASDKPSESILQGSTKTATTASLNLSNILVDVSDQYSDSQPSVSIRPEQGHAATALSHSSIYALQTDKRTTDQSRVPSRSTIAPLLVPEQHNTFPTSTVLVTFDDAPTFPQRNVFPSIESVPSGDSPRVFPNATPPGNTTQPENLTERHVVMDYSSAQNAAVRVVEDGTGVAITEVLVVEHDGMKRDDASNESDGSEEGYGFDDDAYEVQSDLDELSMVEPVPMDDFDYGLM